MEDLVVLHVILGILEIAEKNHVHLRYTPIMKSTVILEDNNIGGHFIYIHVETNCDDDFIGNKIAPNNLLAESLHRT